MEDVNMSDAEIAEHFLSSHSALSKKEAKLEQKWDRFIFRHRETADGPLDYLKSLEKAEKEDRKKLATLVHEGVPMKYRSGLWKALAQISSF